MRFTTFRNLVAAGAATLGLGIVGGGVALYRALPDAPAPAVRPAPTPIAPTPAGDPRDASLRPVDRSILDVLAHPPASDKIKDAFPHETYKVNLYRDTPGAVWTRLKVDLDRDDLDDEKWDLTNGQPAKRHVSSKDDGTYDLEYRWDGGKWLQKAP